VSDVPAESMGHPQVATLVRTIPVRVLDVSRGGCRLEAARPVPSGVSGRLTLPMGGRLRVDDVRVARCQPRVGAGTLCYLGAELLRTRRLHVRSVRMAVGQIISEQPRGTGHADGLNSESASLETMGQRDERKKAVSRAPPEAATVG